MELESRKIAGSRNKGILSKNHFKVLIFVSSALAISVYLLISLGGLVRNAGAGLSCPDWPLCHGQIIPDQMIGKSSHPVITPVQIFLEWFHRLIAGFVSLATLFISYYVFSNRNLRAHLGKVTAASILLLSAQVVLGGLTVLGLLSPKWVTSHLAFGLAFFMTMVWISLEFRKLNSIYNHIPVSQVEIKTTNLSKLVTNVLGIIFIQAILGGLVSSNYAGLACPDFPTCNGQWIPPFEGLIRFQTLHRVGAYLSFFAVFYLSFQFLKNWETYRNLKSKIFVIGVPCLLSLQLFLGIGMIFWQLPLLMSVAHLAVAAALVGSLMIIVHELKNSRYHGKYFN